MTFFDRLRALVTERDSRLCVGLDPDPERIPGGIDGAVDLCTDVVRATADLVCCFKPNSAFWEQYGPDGWRGLLAVREAIGPDIPVILDAKRADVGHTMDAYARTVFDVLAMDAVTVHAYHGADSLDRFTRYADRGVYVVCHTSNPGRTDLQHLSAPDEPLYLRVAALAERVNEHGNVGLVVGATAPDEATTLRAVSSLPFLMPGVGRQGGDVAAAVLAAATDDPASCVISVSGAVLYEPDPRAAAQRWLDEIRACEPVTR